jgi:hypothetical protein
MGAVSFLVALTLAQGSASAFPDYGSVVSANVVSAGPQVESIYINSSTPLSVYMGPYQLQLTSGNPASSYTTYMMCFDAGASAYYSPPWTALVTDANGAATYYGVYGQEKVEMIACLATQWNTTNLTTSPNNANINKAMWEIMADYSGTLASLDVNSGKGNFYLGTGDIDINGNAVAGIIGVHTLLAQAYEHRSDAIAANFLIPLKDGNLDLTIQPFVQPVPEPGTLLLPGSRLTGLGFLGWRKCSRAQR